jgi:hypothetical protein
LAAVPALAQEGAPNPKASAAVATVSAIPPVAPPGVARRLVVSGIWPTACIPAIAQVAEGPFAFRPRAVVILLAELQAPAACAAAPTSFRHEVEFTPESAGQRDILVVTNLAGAVARGTLVTGSALEPRARYDATGTWYDPRTGGSGLMVIHDFGATDRLFATWQVYGTDGTARWYSVQEGAWSADGLAWNGLLYETKAAEATCELCPVVATAPVRVAFVRLAFSATGQTGGLVAAMNVISSVVSPSVQQFSLVRLLPSRVVTFD